MVFRRNRSAKLNVRIVKLIGLLLLSAAHAASADDSYDNPYDKEIDNCFIQQLQSGGEWPQGIVSWSKLIVACPEIVNKEFEYCKQYYAKHHRPDQRVCIDNILEIADMDIETATSPLTH